MLVRGRAEYWRSPFRAREICVPTGLAGEMCFPKPFSCLFCLVALREKPKTSSAGNHAKTIPITVAILAQDGVSCVDALCYVRRAVLLATRADMCCLGVRTAQHSIRSIAGLMHARASVGWLGGAYEHALPAGDMR